MSESRDKNKDDDLGFSWGKKRSKGLQNKDIQFYDSFTYDGVEYSLYDSVYLFKDGEPEPYIGKLIKIWDQSSKGKKVKVLWFFRPSEISTFLDGVNVLENELFLACGDGKGLANINPLEAIAGKCNVVCISKDERNRQPSDVELEKADNVFYRTFDVRNNSISEKLGEKIAAIEVSYLLNKIDNTFLDVRTDNADNGNVAVATDKPPIPVQDTPGEDEALVPNAMKGSSSVKDEEGLKAILDKQNCDPLEKHGGAGPEDTGPAAVLATELVTVSAQKTGFGSPGADQNDMDKIIKSAGNVGPSDCKSFSKSKQSGAAMTLDPPKKNHGLKLVANSSANHVKGLTPSPAADDKGKSELAKDINGPTGAVRKMKAVIDPVALEERPTKKLKLGSTVKPLAEKARNGTQKSASVSIVIKKSSRDAAFTTETNGNGKLSKELGETSNGVSKSLNSEHVGLGPAAGAAAVTAETIGRGELAKESGGTSNGVSKRFISKCAGSGSGVAAATTTTTKTDGKGKLGKELVGTSNGLSKKLESKGVTENKSNEKLQEGSFRKSKNVEIEAYGHVKEVTPRPCIDKRNWFTGWGERMKTAKSQGRLVLLQNLEPGYTSSDVEDVIWHAFGENCTAKMVQRTATSSRHYGEAFVIFRSREAAEKVANKLDRECLMVNGRPLIGIPWVTTVPEEQTPFPGHLVIEKLRPQLQREAKAVSTSHPSQPNTLEYEMAMEWRLLQERADLWWKMLYKVQGQNMRKLTAKLKSK